MREPVPRGATSIRQLFVFPVTTCAPQSHSRACADAAPTEKAARLLCHGQRVILGAHVVIQLGYQSEGQTQ